MSYTLTEAGEDCMGRQLEDLHVNGNHTYRFMRNVIWEAYPVINGKVSLERADKDQYRHDLAERLSLKHRSA